MKSFILLTSLTIALVGCSLNQAKQDSHKVIAENKLERPINDFAKLPNSLKQLSEALSASEFHELFEKSKEDQWERFTVVNVAKFKITSNLSQEDKQTFRELFIKATKDEFEWIQTVGVWGVGHTGGMQDMHGLITMLDHTNPVVVDETLLALEILFAREQTKEPTRAPASAEDNVLTIHDVNYWKKFKL